MIRYTLSAIAATRPMMLSALKTLDPLDDQSEDGESRDGQYDVEDVAHLGLLGLDSVDIWPAGEPREASEPGPAQSGHQECNSTPEPK